MVNVPPLVVEVSSDWIPVPCAKVTVSPSVTVAVSTPLPSLRIQDDIDPVAVVYPAPLVMALLFKDMLALPLKETPAILLAVCKTVALPALPLTVVWTILLVLAVLAATAVLFVISDWTVVV